ncbi:hypothetical protein M3Y99_01772600 [Aphelenchoides fujianensis]|nr:hypothetical protein M3Y99_01772600 [Aphelenchoides fujianensis]
MTARLQQSLVFAVFHLLVIGFASSAPEVPFGNECFELIDHRGVSNSEAIAQLWSVTPFDCLAYCVKSAAKTGDGCAAVVYHKRFLTCSLYNHDGNFNGSKLVFAAGPRILQPDLVRRQMRRSARYPPFPPHVAIPQGQNRPKALAHDSFPIDQTSDLTVLDEKTAGSASAIKVEPKPRVDGLLFSNPPAPKECERGQKIAYFSVPSYAIGSAEPRAIIKKIDQEACLIYCTQQINAIGDATRCIAAVYDREQEICELYDESIKELGVLSPLQFNSTTRTSSEKFCIDESRACEPGAAFIVHHKKKIVNATIAQIRSVDSVAECLKACHQNRQCQSITFRSGRCLLEGKPPGADDSSNMAAADASSLVIGARCTKL